MSVHRSETFLLTQYVDFRTAIADVLSVLFSDTELEPHLTAQN